MLSGDHDQKINALQKNILSVTTFAIDYGIDVYQRYIEQQLQHSLNNLHILSYQNNACTSAKMRKPC